MLKAYQIARFEQTYSDLLGNSPYREAARFFLDELYGSRDFVERDHQFARIVPSLVRMLPTVLVEAVESLVRLHALSESLDTRMARLLNVERVDANAYQNAWRCCGEFRSRYEQIELTLGIGLTLIRYTRKVWLRRTLKFMRGPANSVGLGDLQSFLERGFNTFGALKQPETFLHTIRQRETAFVSALCSQMQDSVVPRR